jgi:cytochrome o ubiquinol oxidase operon protein cyoD
MNVANEARAGDGPPGRHRAHGPTLQRYSIGLALAVILTVIPFALVMHHTVAATPLVITGFALAQILVHIVYFLHVDASEEKRWNLMALLYTGVMVFIVLGGSLWIMHHLSVNMVPDAMHGNVWK